MQLIFIFVLQLKSVCLLYGMKSSLFLQKLQLFSVADLEVPVIKEPLILKDLALYSKDCCQLILFDELV